MEVKTTLSFPETLWKKVRLKAIQEGVPVKEVAAEFLERWVKGDIKLHDKEKLAA